MPAEYEPISALHPDADPGILAIDHVGLAVPDLDVAVAFHTDVLGLRLEHAEINHEQGVTEAMMTASPAADVVSTERARPTQVQLLAPINETSALARFLSRSGPGIQHLAYSVRDVERAARVLQRKGLRLLYDSAKPGTRGSRINFVHPKDAGGVLIELVESSGTDAESGGHRRGGPSA